MVRKHLRGEQKFDGLDGLKLQLAIDKENALAALGR
jgi:FAD synthase